VSKESVFLLPLWKTQRILWKTFPCGQVKKERVRKPPTAKMRVKCEEVPHRNDSFLTILFYFLITLH
jgi:hypothetical protein